MTALNDGYLDMPVLFLNARYDSCAKAGSSTRSRVALRGRFLQRHPEVASALVVGGQSSGAHPRKTVSGRIGCVLWCRGSYASEIKAMTQSPWALAGLRGRVPDRINLWAASSAG